MKLLKSTAGFSIVDTLVTVSIGVVLAAVAVPAALTGVSSMSVQGDARAVEQALQTARFRAIQSNVTVRVMFDCPVAGQFRVVELLGTHATPSGSDGTLGRCDETVYPYPPHSTSQYAPTAADGPLMRLTKKNSFVNDGTTATNTFYEFWEDGTAHRGTGGYPLAQIATGAAAGTTNVAVTNGTRTISITVYGNGKIRDNR
jgi:Tfp pilus assembly protein FimT